MDLQLASAWLERDKVGFSDIHTFAVQCRDASRELGRESAALVLLAERVAAFVDRYEGIAISTNVVADFLGQLKLETMALRDASAGSDADFLAALNAFAVRLASDLFI